jgi:hypothetical protein
MSGVATTAAAGSSITFHVVDAAAASNNFVATSGITVESLSSVVPNFATNPISANNSTTATVTGTYSGSSTANVPITAGAVRQCVLTAPVASGVTSDQVTTSCATTTGWMAVAVVHTWIAAACSSSTLGVTSPNETFNAATTAIGQAGVPPPYVNCVQMFYAYNITGNAADKPTCTVTPSQGLGCSIVYYSNVPTTDPRDQHPSPTKDTTGTLTSCTAPSITTVQNNEIIDVMCDPNSATSFTAPSGYANIDNNGSNYLFSDSIVSATQTVAPITSYSPANNESSLIASFKANAPPAGSATLSSGTPACAVVNNNVIQAQPVIAQCTSVITATVGATTGTGTITVNPSSTDTSIIIIPNPTASASITPPNNTILLKAIGNVTSQLYTASWGISPTSPNGTLSSNTGTQVTATCLNAVGTYTINATVAGLTGGSTTLNCVASQVITLADCAPTTFHNDWATMSSGVYIIKFPSCSGTSTAANGVWSSNDTETIPTNVTSVTIQGNTTVTCTGSAGTSTYTCVAVDNTIISDAYAQPCCSNQLLIINTTSGASFRMTGMTFQGGNIVSVNNSKQPILQFGGSSQNFRLDHCHFNTNTYSPSINPNWVRWYGGAGVLDHNLVDLGSNQSVSSGFNISNGSGDSGNTTWNTVTGWGTISPSSFFYMEANVFNGGAPNDCSNAGRFVMRYNTVNAAFVGTEDHATKSEAFGRGCRALEVYHNYFSGSPPSFQDAIGLKGATALIWSNTLASGYLRLINVQTDRNSGGTTETATPNGWGYCGTAVKSNGVGSLWDGNSPSGTPTASGYPCLDGIGRGQTTQLITGGWFPNLINSSTGTIAWPHQYLEPIYAWQNTISSGTLLVIEGTDTQQNRDVYVDNGSFTGSTGTGFGAGSSRPATCTAGPGGTYDTSPTGSYGVAYFSTDNTGGLVANTLYVCTATNTWTAIYTPYTYPHPLDTGP